MGRDVSMTAMAHDSRTHWEIFCRVIDNFGDIGVCWRLARQLASEYGLSVRLFVDDLTPLAAICPPVDPQLAQQLYQGVDIRHWPADFAVDRVGEVIIEAFACELPPGYLAAMAATTRRPVWLNLEYLTAEAWAEDWHGLASPHPTLPLQKFFFFPGFGPRSGGLLRERGLLDRMASEPTQRDDTLHISLFCYDTAPVGDWLDALATDPTPCVVHAAPGKPLAAVRAHLSGDGPWQLGAARIEPMPFLALDDYDRLLWRCDINFIRGEDSFVRAQWAGKPFIWQIYRQEEDAHLVKLAAFLERCCPAGPWRRMNEAWNTGIGISAAWRELLAARTALKADASAWREALAALPDLASSLVKFVDKRL